jgi:hypothetical protein
VREDLPFNYKPVIERQLISEDAEVNNHSGDHDYSYDDDDDDDFSDN